MWQSAGKFRSQRTPNPESVTCCLPIACCAALICCGCTAKLTCTPRPQDPVLGLRMTSSSLRRSWTCFGVRHAGIQPVLPHSSHSGRLWSRRQPAASLACPADHQAVRTSWGESACRLLPAVRCAGLLLCWQLPWCV